MLEFVCTIQFFSPWIKIRKNIDYYIKIFNKIRNDVFLNKLKI